MRLSMSFAGTSAAALLLMAGAAMMPLSAQAAERQIGVQLKTFSIDEKPAATDVNAETGAAGKSQDEVAEIEPPVKPKAEAPSSTDADAEEEAPAASPAQQAEDEEADQPAPPVKKQKKAAAKPAPEEIEDGEEEEEAQTAELKSSRKKPVAEEDDQSYEDSGYTPSSCH